MADYDDLTPRFLSGCANGLPLLVTASTAGGANTIDTATSSTDDADFWHVWATNTHTAALKFVVLVGGTTEPDNVVYSETVEAGMRVIVLDGYMVNNSKTLKAYGATGSKFTVDGMKWTRTGA